MGGEGPVHIIGHFEKCHNTLCLYPQNFV